MKKSTNIIYWIATILLAIGMLISSIPDLLKLPQAMKFITDLGYPAYIIPFLSIAKLLAAVALLVPGFPRIREWAYAGITFDFLGATYSQMENPPAGSPQGAWAFMVIWFAVLAASYIFYHKRMKKAE